MKNVRILKVSVRTVVCLHMRVWHKKGGFISTLCLALESQRLSNTTMFAEASLQRGLLQVLELSMFQLSDKQAGDTQSWPFHSYAL